MCICIQKRKKELTIADKMLNPTRYAKSAILHVDEQY